MMPLAIIQARYGSTRLPEKMLLPIQRKPLVWWAWDLCHRFAETVIACPLGDAETFRTAVPTATVFGWGGDVNDVLGRIHACAHTYRETPTAWICRVTPDDFPIDLTRETFTLKQLDQWHHTVTDPNLREHIGHLMVPRIEINTRGDYDALRERMS